jgi:4-hydroxy-3-polyprenylbenzoate decarboxylase
MSYRTLRQCIDDLAASGRLRRIEEPIDARLEAAEIQRRVFRAGGPALYFANVKGCRFPMVSNLFGTLERARYIFRDSLDKLKQLVSLQADPLDLLRRPRLYVKSPWFALNARVKTVRTGPVLAHETTLAELPQLVSWPGDGGAYITLPQVYTEDPDAPGFARSNLGMYRVQISGGGYAANREAGMHYQLQRGIAAHHAAALRRNEPLRVNVFVGGPPAMTVAAVMPLPEGMSELTFAGLLGRRRVPMIRREGELPIAAEADFCITGRLDPVALRTSPEAACGAGVSPAQAAGTAAPQDGIPAELKPEGPFGDHLGYYSLAHAFPVLRVERVYHREGAIWPFTVVGRPPQEDTIFGELIHELVGPVIPKTIPGVKAVHAVDAAGVHPLLLAIGSERYAPYEERRRPRELLTLANALLGQGQLSLAKYLWIAAGEDCPNLDVRNVVEFFRHVLERVDWRRDLHFQTCTTIDTLDYSGGALGEGSKLVIAAAGPAIRKLPTALDGAIRLPGELGIGNPRIFMPGVLVLEVNKGEGGRGKGEEESFINGLWPVASEQNLSTSALSLPPSPFPLPPSLTLAERFAACYTCNDPINAFPWIVLADSSDFTARSAENFLWTVFTKSNPATDVFGIDPLCVDKHWGCRGSLVIDARAKPHHAPPLVEDPAVTARVEALAARGGPMHGII